MRHPLKTSIVIACLGAPVLAQGLITAPQQSLEGSVVPGDNDDLRIAITGDRMAVLKETFVRQDNDWLPADPLIGVVRRVAGDGGRFATGNPGKWINGLVDVGSALVQNETPTGWTIDVLTPNDPPLQRLRFGTEVAISGDTVAVLAPGWRPAGQALDDAVGAVYVFRETPGGWAQEALLTPTGGDLFDHVLPTDDVRLALDGDTLVVTGRDALAGGGYRSALFVMQRSAGTWSPAAELTFPGLAFPHIDVQEDVPGVQATIVAHSSYVGLIFTGHGATWQVQDIGAGSWRGPVGLSGSVLAVAYQVDGTGGSVQLYERNAAGTWEFREVLNPITPHPGEFFGATLAFDGEWLAVSYGNSSGAVPLSADVDVSRVLPAGAGEYCAGLPTSTGQVARIASSGSTSVAANDLELVAGPVPTANGMFFYGGAQLQIPFGDGFRCVGSGPAGIFRLPGAAGGNGILTRQLDLAAPAPAGGQILPGSTWYFQAWFRDPAAGGSGFNLSTGLELTFQ